MGTVVTVVYTEGTVDTLCTVDTIGTVCAMSTYIRVHCPCCCC